MDNETRKAIQRLAKKALQNQAHIMTILRLLAVKGIINTREFNAMYDKTLRELKEDTIRGMMARQDEELASLAATLRRM